MPRPARLSLTSAASGATALRRPGWRWRALLRLLAWVGLGCLAGAGAAQDNSAAALASHYASMRSQLEASALGVPATVVSTEDGDLVRGEVYAVLAQPFDLVSARLAMPRDWCRIVLLHLNIKAALHERTANQDWLTFYSGRKFYESPDQAYPLRFAFRAVDARADHLDVDLRAPSGPMGTSDYRITLGAIPVAQGSFVRFTYSYRTSMMSRLAMSTYLATLGQGKVGFTVVGKGADGKPEYVAGRRGIVERNAVRYYLAIQAYLEGQALPPAQRFEHDLGRWFDLTERFALQLHELDRAEYLQGKRQEFDEQSRRQQALDTDSGARRPAVVQ